VRQSTACFGKKEENVPPRKKRRAGRRAAIRAVNADSVKGHIEHDGQHFEVISNDQDQERT